MSNTLDKMQNISDRFAEAKKDYQDGVGDLVADLLGQLQDAHDEGSNLGNQVEMLRSRLGRLVNENISLRQSLKEATFGGGPQELLINQEASLRRWQEWWSKEMRPAVIRLVDSTGPVADYLRDIEEAGRNFPRLNEFPVPRNIHKKVGPVT